VVVINCTIMDNVNWK